MTRSARLALLSGAALLVSLPAAAGAQTPTTPTPAPATTPAPTPAPKAVSGKLALKAEKVGSGRTVLAGTRFRLRGVLTPYVPGQKAVVRVYRHGKKIAAQELSLQKSASGESGSFVMGFSTKLTGTLLIKASHKATPELKTVVARPVKVGVLPLKAGPGSSGAVVQELQRRLKALGYVTGAFGQYDGRTARAVQAFRKMTGMPRTFTADQNVFRKLAAGAGAFKVRYPSHGRHIEGDLTHQVLALIGKGGKVERLYPMSSGKPSTPTVLGHFSVYSKTPGTNAKGMVYSSYFIRGYAVHGYAEVPDYPASHGCLRVPVPDAVSIYNWIEYGTPVDVYYR